LASVRFQLDEHVPHAVAQALRRRGIDVVTTTEAELLGAPDTDQLRGSQVAGRVLVTRDRDFLRLHREGAQHSDIAYCDQGSRTVGELVAALTLIYEILDANEMVGRLEYL
jgi:predicted nuclease of predicted toxin-antitoxin system